MTTKKRLLRVALGLVTAAALSAQFGTAAGKAPKSEAASRRANAKYGFASGADQVLSAVYDAGTNTLRIEGAAGGGGSSVSLQTNGAVNGSQSVLNLESGTNILLANAAGTGNVTINFAGVLPSSEVAAEHTWLSSYNASTGAFTASQPSFLDLSGTVGATQLPAGIPLFSGTTTAGDCAEWASSGVLADAGAACSAGPSSPSGANTDIQFNNSGAFAGSANFTFDSTTGIVTAQGFQTAGGLAAGCLTLNELPSNGSNNVQLCAPNSVAAGVKWTLPSADGPNGQVLSTNGSGVLGWSAPGMSDPMTTLGDITYENSTPAPARLAGNTTSTLNVLTQTGTGSVSAAPAWSSLAGLNVPTQTGTITIGDCVKWASGTQITDAGAACGSTLSIFAQGMRTGSAWGVGVANAIRTIGFVLPNAVQTSAITFFVDTADTTSGDVYDVGLYGPCAGNASCSLVVHTGATALNATGNATANWTEGSLTLQPGRYYLAFTGNAASGAIDGDDAVHCTFSGATGNPASSLGGALPSSITTPADSYTCSGAGGDFILH